MNSSTIKVSVLLAICLHFVLIARLSLSAAHQIVAHPCVLFLDEDWPVGKELDVKICAETEKDVPFKVHLVRQANESGADAEEQKYKQFSVVPYNESCFTVMLNMPLEADSPLPPRNAEEVAFAMPFPPSFSLLFERDGTGDRASVQVQLVDVNDNAPRFLGGPFPVELIVPEDSSPGFLLRRLEVTDSDRGIGGICRFSLNWTSKGTEELPELFVLDNQQCQWPRCSANLRLNRRMAEGDLVKVRVKARDGAGLTTRANEAMAELEVIVVGVNNGGDGGGLGGGRRKETLVEEVTEPEQNKGAKRRKNGPTKKDKNNNGRGERKIEGQVEEEKEDQVEEEKEDQVEGGMSDESSSLLASASSPLPSSAFSSSPSSSSSSPPFSSFTLSPPFRTFLIDRLSEDAPDGMEILRLPLPSDQSFHFVMRNSNGSKNGLRMLANFSVRVKAPLDAQIAEEMMAEVRSMKDDRAVAVIRARIWPMMDQFRQWMDKEIPPNGQIHLGMGTGRWVRVLALPPELYKYAHVKDGGEGVKMRGHELMVENDGKDGENKGRVGRGEEGREEESRERETQRRGGGGGGGGRETQFGGKGNRGIKVRRGIEGEREEKQNEKEEGQKKEKEEKDEKEEGQKEKKEEEKYVPKKCFNFALRFRNEQLLRALCVHLPSSSNEWLLQLHWPPGQFRLSFAENVPLPPVLLKPNVSILFPPFASPSFLLINDFTDNAKFIINPNSGELSFANHSRIFDFETQSLYSVGVSVCVSAGGRRSGCQQFVLRIDVVDTNDHCPQFDDSQMNQTVPIREDLSPNLTLPIAHFARATDADGTYQWRSVCYRLVNSFGQTFAIPNPEKAELFLSKALDKETVSVYELEIEAADCARVFRHRCAPPNSVPPIPSPSFQFMPSISKVFSFLRLFVSVSDVNDNSPRFTRRHFFASLISLDVKPGDALIRLRADDPDEMDQPQSGQLRFEWGRQMVIRTEGDPIPIDASPFHLDKIRGEVSIKSDFDQTSVPLQHSTSYTLHVVVHDSGARHSDSSILTFSVLDPSVHIVQINFSVNCLLLVDGLDLLEQLLSIAIGHEWRALNHQLSRCGGKFSRMRAYFLAKDTFRPIEAEKALNELKSVVNKGNEEQRMALNALRQRFGLTIDEEKHNNKSLVPFDPSGAGHFRRLGALSRVFFPSLSVLMALILLLMLLFVYRRRRAKIFRNRINALRTVAPRAESVFWRWSDAKFEAVDDAAKTNSTRSFGGPKRQKSQFFMSVPQMFDGSGRDQSSAFTFGTLPSVFIPRVRPPNPSSTIRTEF